MTSKSLLLSIRQPSVLWLPTTIDFKSTLISLPFLKISRVCIRPCSWWNPTTLRSRNRTWKERSKWVTTSSTKSIFSRPLNTGSEKIKIYRSWTSDWRTALVLKTKTKTWSWTDSLFYYLHKIIWTRSDSEGRIYWTVQRPSQLRREGNYSCLQTKFTLNCAC